MTEVMKRQNSGKSSPIGLIAMLGSAFLFSIMALIVKVLDEFGTFELVFWRSFFMTIGTTTMLILLKKSLLGPPGRRGILIWRGIAGFGFMSAFYYAIKMMKLSDAIVITYTSPVITGVGAALLLGEKWGLLDAVGSTLCLVGVVLISKPSFVMTLFGITATPPPLNGTIGALVSALLASSVYLLLRKAKDLDPIVSVNYFAVIGMILSPVGMAFNSETMHWPEGFAWVQLSLLAGLSVFGQALMNIGLARESAGKATAMNYVQVVFAYVYQIYIFHHECDTLSVIGAVLIASWGAIALAKEAMLKSSATDFSAFPENSLPGGGTRLVTPGGSPALKEAAGPLLKANA
mmetsp:Transcript_85655/g.247303  ORF Transcript_85655/g.247303 Transcript_85655/m.247303 type:complete len:348 (-) Transcript_85655:57-1100(-)